MSERHATILRYAAEYCVECDDSYQFSHEGGTCAEQGHHRLITPADFHKVVCPRCRGEGTLGGYPGVYTQADFAEDPDLYDDYMAYRRICEDCGGLRVIDELTPEAEERPEVQQYLREAYESYAIEDMERRMGA
jgi:hypothetical protein